MVKHTQTIRQLLPTSCLSLFYHFVRLALKGLKNRSFQLGRIKHIYGASKHCVWQNSILKKNLFLLHSGKVRNDSIKEMTWLKYTAFKATMVMPSLLLQTPVKTFEQKDHWLTLRNRMREWFNGDILNFQHEGKTIQTSLKEPTRSKDIHQI